MGLPELGHPRSRGECVADPTLRGMTRPELEPYPAGWWRMVVARATAEVPGVDIAYA